MNTSPISHFVSDLRTPSPRPPNETSSGKLRVRVHLNLANPELAENVVRVKAPSGAWITVAYATELALENCIPVVDHRAQERIRQGASKKPRMLSLRAT
jgi:hypothetical protein